jgi:hypothetical protein
MTLTITHEMTALQELQEAADRMGYGIGNSATERMLREVEKIKRLHEQMDAFSAAERITREVEAIRQQASGIWSALQEARHRAFEHIERFRQQMAVIERLQRQTQVTRHRGKDGATGKGRGKTSSAKKSAKSTSSGNSGGGSSGGDGGDGGGDGDGPQRIRSTPKKSRSSKSVTTRPQRLPSSSSGKTATTFPPQVLPNHPQSNRGIAIIAMFFLFGIVFTDPSPFIIGLIVVCLLIIALVAMGYPDLAKHVWSSIPKLLKLLAADSDEESEDSDDES